MKVLRTTSEVKHQDIRGRVVPRQGVIVADQTGSMELTLWGDLIPEVEVNGVYTFTELTVRRYNQTTLTTTRQTSVTAGAIGGVNEMPVEGGAEIEVLEVDEVVQARISKSITCGACHKAMADQVEASTRFTKCMSCGMRQKTLSLVQRYSCVINVKTATAMKKVMIGNQVLVDFFEKENYVKISDTDSLEEYLLEAPKMRLQVTGNNVIDMSMIDDTYSVDCDIDGEIESDQGKDTSEEGASLAQQN